VRESFLCFKLLLSSRLPCLFEDQARVQIEGVEVSSGIYGLSCDGVKMIMVAESGDRGRGTWEVKGGAVLKYEWGGDVVVLVW